MDTAPDDARVLLDLRGQPQTVLPKIHFDQRPVNSKLEVLPFGCRSFVGVRHRMKDKMRPLFLDAEFNALSKLAARLHSQLSALLTAIARAFRSERQLLSPMTFHLIDFAGLRIYGTDRDDLIHRTGIITGSLQVDCGTADRNRVKRTIGFICSKNPRARNKPQHDGQHTLQADQPREVFVTAPTHWPYR